MKPAMDRLNEWKRDMKLVFEDIWVHCNAHIEPALAGALSKVLLEIEEVLGEYESPFLSLMFYFGYYLNPARLL
jgi:hypothetical protein